MPPELKNRPDMTWGKDKGRIWRIVPEKHKTKTLRPELGKANTDGLMTALGSGNVWTRMTAHRLLLEARGRGDKKITDDKRKGTDGNEELFRLHLLCTLDATGGTADFVLKTALLVEQDPRLLEHAVRFAEPRLSRSAEVREYVFHLATHDSAVALSGRAESRAWDDDRILDPLTTIALKDADDKWTRLAVESSVATRSGKLVAALLKGGLTKKASDGRLALLRELSAVVGARQDAEEVAGLLHTLADTDSRRWEMTGLDGLAEGMGRRGTQLGTFLTGLPDKHHAASIAAHLLVQAARVADDAKAEPSERLTALRLMAHTSWTTAEPVLAKLVTEDGPQELRLAAVRALSALPNAEVASVLMKSWPAYTPALRREVAEAMLRQPDRALFLLGEIEAKRVRPGDLDVQRQRQLVNHGKAEVRERAKKLLQDSLPAERKKVLEQYQAALKRKGDPKKGQEVFRKNCATCHRLAGIGVEVGPNIADAERTRTAEALLTDILNPNAAIDANYINYQVTLKSGKVLTGLIAAETAASLTLKRAENQTDTVLRQDVEEVRSTGVSLMPEGLEKTVSVEEMADLLGFLKNWRYLDGVVPGK